MRLMLVGLLIGAVVAAVYSNTLPNGFVVDDSPFVEKNPIIRDLANVPEMFTTAFWEPTPEAREVLYRPLVTLSYALNFALGGLDPVGYHVVNVLLHVCNTLLVLLVVYLVSRRTLFSAAVAAFFGLHPVTTEAVAWIAQRSELQAAFFALGALAFFILAFPPARGPDRPSAHARWLHVGSLAAFLFGLLSKEGAIAMVGALLLYDLGFRGSMGRWIRLTPYLVLTALYVLALQLAFGGIGTAGIDFVLNPLVQESGLVRVLTGVKLLGMALWTLAWPVRLTADYSFNAIPLARAPWDAGVVAAGLAAMTVAGLWWVAWRRHRMLFLGLGVLVSYTALLFVNAVHPAASMFAERFLYMPTVGFALAIVGAADLALRYAPKARAIIGSGTIMLVLIGYSARVRSRNVEWQDNYTLFTSAAQVNPRSAFVQAALASEYFDRGDYNSTRVHSLRALEIYPEYSRAYVHLGDAALAENANEEAMNLLTSAVRLSPQSYRAHLSLGVAYKRLGDLNAAEAHYNQALAINPNQPGTLNNLANLLLLRGDRAAALTLLRRALALDPSNPEVLFNLATTSESMGEAAQARDYYRRFLSVAPERMQYQRSMVQSKLNRP